MSKVTISELHSVLNGSGRILILHGPQGSGKNTLARKLARDRGEWSEISAKDLAGKYTPYLANEPKTLIVDMELMEGLPCLPDLIRLAEHTTMSCNVKHMEVKKVLTPSFILCSTSTRKVCAETRIRSVEMESVAWDRELESRVLTTLVEEFGSSIPKLEEYRQTVMSAPLDSMLFQALTELVRQFTDRETISGLPVSSMSAIEAARVLRLKADLLDSPRRAGQFAGGIMPCGGGTVHERRPVRPRPPGKFVGYKERRD